MKKAVSRILIAVMVLSIALTAIVGVASAESKKIQITGDSVNVRAKANINSKIIGTVYKGAVLTSDNGYAVDSRGVTWYSVTYKNQTGYVSSKYSKIYDGSSTGSYIYATGGSSYIRSTNSLSGKILGSLPQGAKASYMGESKKDNRNVYWYKIKYNGITGWVSSKYTSNKSNGSSSSSSSKVTGSKVTAVSGKTYIRNDYSLNGKILGTLKQGSSLTYLNDVRYDNRNVAWYKVSYNGGTGWVSSKYTKVK